MEPQIRFCTSRDGTKIAFSTYGSGVRPALIMINAWAGSMQDRAPWFDVFGNDLAQDRCVIRFDRRGVGMSQRIVHDLSLDAHLADVEAVRQELRLERFELLGLSTDGSAVAAAYAALHPEYVEHLVLCGPYARGADVSNAKQTRGLAGLARGSWPLATRAIADVAYPNGPIEAQQQFAKALRESMSGETGAGYIEFQADLDVSELLPNVQAPTLVIMRRGTRFPPRRAVRVVAELVPDARLAVLEGDSPHAMDWGRAAQIVREFLAEGEPQEANPDLPSGTAIILFTDIADSTALTERLGDAAFRGKARELDGALRTVIRECEGTTVEGKLLGDGVLAVFTSARQAIEAAVRCGKAGSHGGLPLHLGIHAGDVIREGDNVFGGAVNIAARIAAASAPGEVLVSDTVRGLARTSAGVSFEDRGEHELKGVSEPQRLFAIRTV